MAERQRKTNKICPAGKHQNLKNFLICWKKYDVCQFKKKKFEDKVH